MRARDRSQAAVAAAVLLLLAVVLVIVGESSARAAAFWTAAPLVTPGRFVDLPVGAPALLVGPLDAPAASGQYAVFVTEYQTCDKDDTCTWRESSRWTPPVTVAGVHVENTDYQLAGALWEQYTWDRRARTRGIPPGATILVAVQHTPAGGAWAYQLYAGTPSAYRSGWTLLVWLLRAGAGVCGLLALVAGWIWWTA